MKTLNEQQVLFATASLVAYLTAEEHMNLTLDVWLRLIGIEAKAKALRQTLMKAAQSDKIKLTFDLNGSGMAKLRDPQNGETFLITHEDLKIMDQKTGAVIFN